MLSKVVLPQPEGPITAMNSPFLTAMFTFCSAFVSTVSDRKLLLMFSNRIIVSLFRSISSFHSIIALFHHRIIPSSHHPIIASSHHRIIASSHHRIIASSHHRITASSPSSAPLPSSCPSGASHSPNPSAFSIPILRFAHFAPPDYSRKLFPKPCQNTKHTDYYTVINKITFKKRQIS